MAFYRFSKVLLCGLFFLPTFSKAEDNQPPDGFTALFNGKDLTGWKGHIDLNERKKPEAEQAKLQQTRDALKVETWLVKDGIIHHVPKIDSKGRKSGCSLQTAKDYGNFEMLIDWKIEKAGDSGLYVRGNPQIQIWDSENLSPNLKADAGTGSGGLWNNPVPAGATPQSVGKVPLVKADKPVGEWNTFRIIMKDDLVTIHLNGVCVVKGAPLANYWEKGRPLPATGPIELQYHGDKLWFKNIYIRDLK